KLRENMRRIYLILILTLVNFLIIQPTSAQKGDEERLVWVHELPTVVITYAFLASRYPETLSDEIKVLADQDEQKLLARLHASLESLGTHFPSTIGFMRRTFL